MVYSVAQALTLRELIKGTTVPMDVKTIQSESVCGIKPCHAMCMAGARCL